MLQLPGVSAELAKKAAEAGVETVFDLMDMEDDDRNKLLGMSEVRACVREQLCACVSRCVHACGCLVAAGWPLTHVFFPVAQPIVPPPRCSLSLHFISSEQNKLAALAAVCNRYPNVSLEYEVVDADEVSAGEQVQMVVKLERENEVRAPPLVCARARLLCTRTCTHAHANLMVSERLERVWSEGVVRGRG